MADRAGNVRGYRFKAAWRRQRAALIKASGGRCALCPATTGLTQAHVIPHSEGGTDDPSNLVILCRRCHGRQDGGARRGSRAR